MLIANLRRQALALLFTTSATMIGCESKLPKIEAEDASLPRADGSGPPPAYVRYEHRPPPLLPPANPPGPPEDAEFTELPDGWMVPGFSRYGSEREGVHVGLQYSGLYWGTETIAEFPDGVVPQQSLDDLATRLEAHGQRNPKRIELFVHPATRFAALHAVVKRIRETGGEVLLVIRSDDRLAGGIELQSRDRVFGPALLADIRASTIELGVQRAEEPPTWTRTLERHGEGHKPAIDEWLLEVVPTERVWLPPTIVAEPDVTVQELVRVYGLLCGLKNCPIPELDIQDVRGTAPQQGL